MNPSVHIPITITVLRQTRFVVPLKELIVILIVTFDGVEVVVVVAVDEVPIEEVVPAVVV